MAQPRARLEIAFRPIRAGINLLSATSENEIVVTNTGDAAADDIRMLVRLFSAHGSQDAELADFYDQPIARPSVPAFSLEPGERRTLTSVAALPRDAIRPLTAGGRPMFVPVAAVNLAYTTLGAPAQFAQAFAIGIERVDSPKLAPFWLDTPPKGYGPGRRAGARGGAGAVTDNEKGGSRGGAALSLVRPSGEQVP